MNQRLSKLFYILYHQYIKRDEKIHNLHLLRESQWFSEEQMAKYQLDKMKTLLLFAKNNSPHYRDIFSKTGFKPEAMVNLSEISNLPVLTKETIRMRFDEIVCKKVNKKYLQMNSTSGSTGEATYFYSDRRAEQIKAPIDFRCKEWLGVPMGAKEFRIWGAHFDIERSKKLKALLFNFFNNRKLMSSYRMDEENVLQIMREIESFKPDLLISYPSTLVHMAETISGTIPDKSASFKKIVTSGEQLYDWQKDIIEKRYGVPVYNFYACREVGPIAQECEKREGLHLISENIFFEVVNEQGEPVIEKEGDILITDLNNFAMPLLRYKIGDRGRILNHMCSCGRNGMRLIKLNGRAFDIIRSPLGDAVGGTFWTLLLRARSDIRQFQVIQDRLNHIKINYVPEEGEILLTEIIKYYIHEIKSKLRGVHVEFQEVESIKKPPSGKLQYVVSKLTP